MYILTTVLAGLVTTAWCACTVSLLSASSDLFTKRMLAVPEAPVDKLSVRSKTPSSVDFSTYEPVRVECPQRDQWVRPAHGVSDEEADWIKGRKQKVLRSLHQYLGRLHLDDFDLKSYLRRLECEPERTPTIGMAISGGGWLSAMTGTAILRAIDDRFAPSVKE